MGRVAAAAAALALVVVSTSAAAAPKVYLGITGNLPRFNDLTGQNSAAHQAFLGWGQGQAYGSPFRNLLTMFGPIPVFQLGTATGPGRREAVTPASIAAGQGDSYLFALNRAIGEFGKLVYVRPMAEMNNPINLYSYERKHDAAHSPPAYRSAFCRIFILLHGGSRARVNAHLRARGMKPVDRDLTLNPYPSRLRVVWNPLAGIEHGADPAGRYFPGNGCTDLIGNDMFSSSPGGGSFEQNQALSDAHPGKPYALPEWGLQGVDDPLFVERRTEMAAYYESKPGSIYDLGSKPRSKKVYSACLTRLGKPPPA